MTFIIFVISSILCVIKACCQYVCCTMERNDAYISLLWASLCFTLSIGFDSIIMIFILFFIFFCLETPARMCYRTLILLVNDSMVSVRGHTTRIVTVLRCIFTRSKIRPIKEQDLNEIIVDNDICFQIYDCPICLDSESDKSKLFLPKCGHVFHKECIKGWMSQGTCPLCRRPLCFQ